jgi:DNA-binding response OmpR family regulator
MARVLVIDDDATVAEVVLAYLARAGLDADHAADGVDGLEMALAAPPDVVVLDLMLPGMDGLEVCRRLRGRLPGLPVVMLTARGEEEDRILGLEVGADDYVTKPFSPRELVLRVQSILRRAAPPRAPGEGAAGNPAAGNPAARASVAGAGPLADGVGPPSDPPVAPLVDGNLVVDTVAHRATLDGDEIALTAREFDLVVHLMRHPGQAYTREQLMREVWGWDFGDQSTVTVHVRRLREKVEADPSSPTRLVTVFGVGYRWDPAAVGP